VRRLLPLFLLAAATAAPAQVKSDWEREYEERLKNAEEQAVPPPALDRKRLVELQLTLAATPTEFRYYVDAGSLSVGADRIVRYVLVARSPGATDNVTFEGVRCASGEYRVYAVGRPDGSWGGRPSEWRPIKRDARLAQNALARRYFCPSRRAVETAQEGVHALRAGGHPLLGGAD